MDDPRQPSGSDAEYVFHQKTHHELYSGKNETLSGPGMRVSNTTRGRKIQFLQGGRGGSTKGMVFRGEWTATPDSPYMKQHEVKVSGGASGGTFVSVVDNNTAIPSAGSPNWVQTASGDSLGYWS